MIPIQPFPIVGLAEAKKHLGETSTERDGEIETKILMASAIVLDYLKVYDPDWLSPPASPEDPTYDNWAINGAPYEVRAATLLVLGELYDNREASTADVLSPTVKSLLHRHRDPALA